MTTIKKYKVCSLISPHVLNIVFVRLNSSVVCKWGCCVSFSRWKERGACLHWPGNGAYPARAQASPGLRSLWALPNKSGETAGCQHSYRPSLSLSPRRPPLRSAVRTVHRPGLSRAVCYQRSQTPMEKRRGACFTTLPKRKTWGEKVEKLALLLIKLHLTETSSVLKRRWKKKKRKRSLNLPSGLDYFCCGCQISGNTFIWHTLISGQIHDIRPCIVRTELCTSVQLSEIQTSAGPRRPKRSLHPFPTVQIRVFLSSLEDTLNYVWLR